MAALLAKENLAAADQLVVDPYAVFVADRLGAGTRRAGQQPHTGRRLKDVGAEGAAVGVKFDAEIAGVAKPGDLVTGIENDCFGENPNQHRAVGHGKSLPLTGESTKLRAEGAEIGSSGQGRTGRHLYQSFLDRCERRS